MSASLVARAGLTVVAVLAACGPAAAGELPGAPPNSIGVRLLGSSSSAAPDARSHSYIVERAAPGTSIRRQIEITNTTASIASVAVYAAAARVLRGTFLFAPGRTQNALSRWAVMNRRTLHVPPGQSASETVTVKIPRRSASGERFAVVWAEIASRAPTTAGLKLVSRVGVRMYITVGAGGGGSAHDFSIGPLVATRTAAGEPLVTSDITNAGAGGLSLRGSLTLVHGPGGLRAGPYPVALRTPLEAGASRVLRVRLDKQLPLGPWLARIELGSGHSKRTMSASITFPPAALSASGERSSNAWIASRSAIAIGALILLAAAIFASRRRARGRPHDIAA
jgi:hypothetical protein